MGGEQEVSPSLLGSGPAALPWAGLESILPRAESCHPYASTDKPDFPLSSRSHGLFYKGASVFS